MYIISLLFTLRHGRWAIPASNPIHNRNPDSDPAVCLISGIYEYTVLRIRSWFLNSLFGQQTPAAVSVLDPGSCLIWTSLMSLLHGWLGVFELIWWSSAVFGDHIKSNESYATEK